MILSSTDSVDVFNSVLVPSTIKLPCTLVLVPSTVNAALPLIVVVAVVLVTVILVVLELIDVCERPASPSSTYFLLAN